MTTRASILYIDDDEGLRRLTKRALERKGYAVTLAAGGQEGVALAGSQTFDLVAVDHYMPGQDGQVTLEQLLALRTPPPVIYVTGSEESRVAVAALKAGAIDYVVKTANEDYFDLLARAIEQALARVALHAEGERTKAELEASNARLQALLHEVNHRVANSLQLVTAFVQLQARNIADEGAKAALADTQRRISAIGQVHKRLYTSDDVQTVAMDEYLHTLLSELQETWSTPTSRRILTLAAEPIRFATDRAVAVGVIVNELVSNACKYAYGADSDGEVRVALVRSENGFQLAVEDDGVGLPADGSIKGTGLGSKLVKAMATTLGSTLEYAEAPRGTRVVVTGSV
jgi:two-component sensor histidine kinase/CheY-like chemotaxis protein